MDMMNSIAAASMQVQNTQLQQAVQTSLLKKTMDAQTAQATALFDQMLPPTNCLIDTYA